jgi:hypothetical protein
VFELPGVIWVGPRLPKGYSTLIIEPGEAGVRLGNADSVSNKANGAIRVASGLPGLA